MLKKAVQQGRSERRGEAYASVRGASERSENAADELFQHPVRRMFFFAAAPGGQYAIFKKELEGRIQGTHSVRGGPGNSDSVISGSLA